MPQPTPNPSRVLLASDLSARCDRALDRAAQLAAGWQARLDVLTVVQAPATPDQTLAWASSGGSGSHGSDGVALAQARRQLADDTRSLPVQAELHVVEGEPATRIAEQAQRLAAALVVSGMAHDEPFGRFFIGSTVQRLARTLPVPLLVVRQRVHGPYRRLCVGTDFSAASAQALRVALAFFPTLPVTLYHASGAGTAAGIDERDEAAPDSAALAEAQRFLAAMALPADQQARVQAVAERGVLEAQLTRHVRAEGVDLVVLAHRGRSALAELLLGSSAARLLDWLPCDTMIVRATEAEPAA